MTTPSVDLNIAMPYGVTVQGDGSNYPSIVGEHSKKATNSSISLPAGPCRVAASWEGPDNISLQVVSGGKMRKLANLPEKAGGGAHCHGHRRRSRRGSNPSLRIEAHARGHGHLGGLPAQLRVAIKAVV